MFKIAIDKKNKRLKFALDVPIPVFIENRDDFKLFIENISRNENFKIFRDNKGNVNSFSIDIDSWIDFIENNFNDEELGFQKKMLDGILRRDFNELGEGLEVNFHQRPFDNSIRYWSFILNQGNFGEYFINRFKWYILSKYSIVSPFPLHVDLETSSMCNMNCPMCYRSQIKNTGQMDIDLFKMTVDECAENNLFSIRLSWRGESLTHPKIEEMIEYATGRIKNVSFLTNAFYLDKNKIDCLIENKVSYVAVSFDGIGENYELIRHPAKFEKSYEKVELLKKRRKDAKSKLPQIRLCTLWPAIKDDSEAYYKTMKEVSDYIVCNPYINFKGPMKVKTDFICQYPWERMVIAYNGDSQCCTGWNADDIILGNIKDSSICDMWHSDLMNKIRSLHAKGKRMKLNSCSECRHGSKGDPNTNIEDILKRGF